MALSRTVPEVLALALQHQQAGRLAQAEAFYREVLAVQPEQPDALHMLGAIAHQAGHHEEAAELIQRAIRQKPNSAACHYNLANVLRARGQIDEAIAAYSRAIALKPDYAEAHANLSLVLKAQGLVDEAVAAGRRAVELKPDSVEAWNNLAGALRQQRNFGGAIDGYGKALTLNPSFAQAHYNLGNVFRELGRLDEAIASYGRAVALNPGHAEAHHHFGMALEERGRLDEAIAEHHRTLALEPDHVEAHNNLGIALTLRGRIAEAIAEYQRAIALRPGYAEAHNNLGVALREGGRLDDAIEAHRCAIQLRPDLAGAHNNLGVALKDRGEGGEAAEVFRHALALDPNQPAVHSNLIFTLYYDPHQTPATIALEQQRWNARFCAPLRRFIAPHTNSRDRARRLKIGYVSAGFRDDAVGANLRPLLRAHDHREFEILCYSGVARPDSLTEGFRQSADQWRNTVGLGDEALAAMIRADGVDILVDLTQHIAGTRLPVFARQPAPVQVSFLGYPDNAGVETIKYRISDRWLEGNDPAERDRRTSDEKVCLIDSFWCYDPQGIEIEVNELPAHATGHVTFGSLNNFGKFNEPVWKLWARVLGAVPDSRLMILSGAGNQRRRALETLAREGVDPQRVEFFDRRPRRAYLELYQQIDIALDPFPYNGHTTSLEALWMGVPVVSMAGETRVSRGGRSILHNLGLPELIATTEDDYLRLAVELAGELPRLATLRGTLRARMESSVLMDAIRFARNIEAAYCAMWTEWCARED